MSSAPPHRCEAVRIAHAIPAARLTVLADCGHFAYLERPDDLRRAIGDLLSA